MNKNEIVTHADGRVSISRCPNHGLIWSLVQCARCMGIFWDRMEKRRRLDLIEAKERTA